MDPTHPHVLIVSLVQTYDRMLTDLKTQLAGQKQEIDDLKAQLAAEQAKNATPQSS